MAKGYSATRAGEHGVNVRLETSANLQLLYDQIEAALQAHRDFLKRPDRRKSADEYAESVRLLDEIATALETYRVALEREFKGRLKSEPP